MIDKDGGFVVPDGLLEALWRQAAMPSLYGRNPVVKDRAYWLNRERQAIAAAHPKARLRRRYRAARSFLKHDLPSRLRNARAALAGEWERSDDDD